MQPNKDEQHCHWHIDLPEEPPGIGGLVLVIIILMAVMATLTYLGG